MAQKPLDLPAAGASGLPVAGKVTPPLGPGQPSSFGLDVLTTKLDLLIQWAQKNSLWPMPFGTACCAIEFMSSVSSHYDLARFGAEVVRFSPRQADLMIVAGTVTDKQAPILKKIYDPLFLIETPMVVTSLETAELIKYASNCFLATKISFINEIANLCEGLGADVRVVAKSVGMDRRIGAKFLHAGPGYGGSCFPKDTHALSAFAKEAGVASRIIDAAIEANDSQMGGRARCMPPTSGQLWFVPGIDRGR